MDNCITSLGLMSGTSLDGIDASIINSDGNSHLKVKVNHFYEYKAEFRQKLRDIPVTWKRGEADEFPAHMVKFPEEPVTGGYAEPPADDGVGIG